MIILPNQRLWKDIEGYCKVLKDLVVLPLEAETEYSLSQGEALSKETYAERKEEIENYILQIFDKVNAVDKLCIALFIFRAVMKKKMYEEDFSYWTPRFKICNYLFFLSLQYLENSKRTLYVASNDRLSIKKIFFAGYTVLENQIIFNEQYFLENKESTDKYFERVEQISTRHEDLHSYQIVNNNLKKYLHMKNISADEIKEAALSKYKEKYFCKSQLENNKSWQKMILNDNISNAKDDIIIVSTHIFNRYDKKFQNFISNFEAKKCQSPYDTESELIFAYKTDNYVYISKKILNDTQTFIEDIIAWGQYENLTKYFFGMPVDQKTLRDYNRLMTYKIADLLLVNDYILPMENVNGLYVPRVEISNYVMDKKMKSKLGDIDLMFYSKYTKILYLIEYKNYQMMISREGDLSAEVSKVSREKTPEKVSERHKYVCDNMEKCTDVLFQNKYDINEVKSIILTTKPCYYFFVNISEKYDYLEWVEFENRIVGKKM